MNLIEKTIATIAPQYAVRRMAARQALDVMGATNWGGGWGGGYEGSTDSRLRNQRAYQRSYARDEDSHIGAYYRGTLRLEARDMRRNYGLVFGACNRFASLVCGSGINPQAKTSDPDWNRAAEAYWTEWVKIADARGRLTLNEMLQLVVKARLLDGECGFVLTDAGRLQPIESERIATPSGKENMIEGKNVCQGIEIDPIGIPQAYWVCARQPNGQIDRNEKTATRVATNDFIHIAQVERFDQLRGVPELASVIAYLRDMQELQTATLNKAKLDALKAWAIYSDAAVGPMSLGPRNVTPTGATMADIRVEKNEAGENWYLEKGAKIESMASGTPHSTYKDFDIGLMKKVAAALSMPYEILMLDGSGSNFSSARAALILAYQTIGIWQQWTIDRFLQRVWNWRIAKAVKYGQLPRPPLRDGVSEWFRVEWVPPPSEWIDPARESQANRIDWELGTRTLTMLARQRGRDAEDMLAEKARDLEMAAALEKKHGLQPGSLIQTERASGNNGKTG